MSVISDVIAKVKQTDPNQPEFHQAVEEASRCGWIRSSDCACRRAARACRPRSWTQGRRGRTARRTTGRRGSWPGCSRRTSPSTPIR